jgi:hypothetical protein
MAYFHQEIPLGKTIFIQAPGFYTLHRSSGTDGNNEFEADSVSMVQVKAGGEPRKPS